MSEESDAFAAADRRAEIAERIEAAKARLAARKAERERAAASPVTVAPECPAPARASPEVCGDPPVPPLPANPKEDAMPKSDPLLAELIAACKGYGAKSACAKALGRSPSFFSDCRRRGSLPEDLRGPVQAWLDGRAAAGATASQSSEEEAPVSAPGKAKRVARRRQVAGDGIPPRPSGIDVPALLRSLALPIRTVYLVECGHLVERQAVVL